MRSVARGAGLLALLWATVGSAQNRSTLIRGHWAVGVSVGVSSFSAASEGTAAGGQHLEFSAYRPTMLGVALAFGGERLRLNLSARYGEPGLGARGLAVPDGEDAATSGLVVFDGAYHLTSFTLGGSMRLLRLRGGPALRPSLALDLERWTGIGSPTRSVLAGQAGLTLEVALTRAFVGTLEGELGYSPASPFRQEDLPQDFVRRGVWRRTLAGGFYWRF